MKVAIAGASGFIGTALRAHLTAAGHQVVPMVRPTSSTNHDDAGKERIGWDPASGILEPDDLLGCGAVINLAGPGIASRRWSKEYRRVLRDARVDSTRLIATAMATLADQDAPERPTILINGSAIGYYGTRGDTELTEESPPGDGFLPSLCIDWEAATGPAIEAGITVSIARTGIVLSPDGGALAKMLPLFRWFVGGRLGSGNQWMSWISLRDQVRALEYLIDHPSAGAFNLTAPHPVRNRDFTKLLGAALHRPTVLPVPAFGPRLVLGKDLANALLFDSQRVIPAALDGEGFEFADAYLGDAFNSLLG